MVQVARWLGGVFLIGALGLLLVGEPALGGGDKKKTKKHDPQHHITHALQQLREAKHALVSATSKELSERHLEAGVIHELEKAIKAVNHAIEHTEHAKKLDKKK